MVRERYQSITQPEHVRRVPQFIEGLGDIQKLFLDQDVPFEEQQGKLQSALDAMWSIASVFYPDGRTGDSSLIPVPSRRLVELGLVSDETGRKIEGRESTIQEGNVDKNTVVIERTESGYRITEQYVDTEGYYTITNKQTGEESEARRDSFMKEVTYLGKSRDGRVEAGIEGGKSKIITHSFNTGTEEPVIEKRRELAVTSRRINTTVALLVEGIVPGYIEKAA